MLRSDDGEEVVLTLPMLSPSGIPVLLSHEGRT